MNGKLKIHFACKLNMRLVMITELLILTFIAKKSRDCPRTIQDTNSKLAGVRVKLANVCFMNYFYGHYHCYIILCSVI